MPNPEDAEIATRASVNWGGSMKWDKGQEEMGWRKGES
jgi:hypothetical protein